MTPKTDTDTDADTNTGDEPATDTDEPDESADEADVEAETESPSDADSPGPGETDAEGPSTVDADEPDDSEPGGPRRAEDDLVSTTRRLSADERASLEDQRDFLLQSLRDLEAEHEAGDVDEDDYRSLRDDYTARAARILRALEASQVKVRTKVPPTSTDDALARSRDRWRRIAVVTGLVAFVALAVVLVVQVMGDRESGETATGDIRETTRDQLNQAAALAGDGQFAQAIAAYDEVLAQDPENAEAMSNKGWLQYQTAESAADAFNGVSTLVASAELDPEHAPTHFFLTTAFAQLGCPTYADSALARLEELDPPTEMLANAPTHEEIAQIDGANCLLPSMD